MSYVDRILSGTVILTILRNEISLEVSFETVVVTRVNKKRYHNHSSVTILMCDHSVISVIVIVIAMRCDCDEA